METVDFGSVAELLDFTKTELDSSRHVVFRGQSNDGYEITPSFSRFWERHALTGGARDRQAVYHKLLHGFKRRVVREGFIDESQLDDFSDLEAYSQHFGCPTRLVDWSYSPYVGLFFALGGTRVIDKGASGGRGALFLLDELQHYKAVIFGRTNSKEDADALDDLDAKKADDRGLQPPFAGNFESLQSYKVEQLTKLNTRLRIQMGCFYTVPLKFQSFDEYSSSFDPSFPFLKKCTFPLDDVGKHIQDLDLMGLNLGRIYDSVEGAAIDSQTALLNSIR